MKRMLVMLLCVVATGLHASQLEEARRIIREAIEMKGHSRTPVRDIELLGLTALERDAIMSEYCEILSERFDDIKLEELYPIISAFYSLDAEDLASYGNQEALDWMRRIERKYKGIGAVYYLVMKGDARDLDIVGEGRHKDLLAKRVAGTNIIPPPSASGGIDLHWRGCILSVTNTGPQGVYVEAILRQCWENLEVETGFTDYGRYQFRDRSKFPPELLTMVVWFDDDGNPVTNVDLAKYGLTMPELDVPNKGRATASRLAAEEPAATTQDDTSVNVAEDEQDVEKAKASHFWLYVVIFHLILFPSLYFMRRKFSKR